MTPWSTVFCRPEERRCLTRSDERGLDSPRDPPAPGVRRGRWHLRRDRDPAPRAAPARLPTYRRERRRGGPGVPGCAATASGPRSWRRVPRRDPARLRAPRRPRCPPLTIAEYVNSRYLLNPL